MTIQDQTPASNPRLVTQNEQSNDNLRIDLNDIQLPRGNSNESGPSTASTIYDPAVLAASPEYQAIVDERNKRDPMQRDNVDQKEVPFHVSSPAARNRIDLPVGGATIRLPQDAHQEQEEEQMERELCCHGFLPLFPSMMAFNFFHIVIGLICIILGTSQLSSGNEDVVGFGSAGRLVITGSYLLAISSIVLGSLFILAGLLGATANYAKAYVSPKSGKAADLVYHCLLFLVTLICIIIFGLNIYSVIVRRGAPVYDTELWKEFVRSDSRHLCNLEQKLKCAAMSLEQCLSDNNETRFTFCPGHFCVEFCRIATDDVSLQPICESCRKDALESIPIFAECRTLEKERSAVQTCEGLLDEDLDNIYSKLLVVAVIVFVWILLVWAVIAYVECFL